MSFIKKIRIKNFKTLKDFEIEQNPLVLLLGKNFSDNNINKMMSISKKNLK